MNAFPVDSPVVQWALSMHWLHQAKTPSSGTNHKLRYLNALLSIFLSRLGWLKCHPSLHCGVNLEWKDFCTLLSIRNILVFCHDILLSSSRTYWKEISPFPQTIAFRIVRTRIWISKRNLWDRGRECKFPNPLCESVYIRGYCNEFLHSFVSCLFIK